MITLSSTMLVPAVIVVYGLVTRVARVVVIVRRLLIALALAVLALALAASGEHGPPSMDPSPGTARTPAGDRPTRREAFARNDDTLFNEFSPPP